MLTAIGSSGGNFDELLVDNPTSTTGLKSFGSVMFYPNPYKNGKLHLDLNGFNDKVSVTITNLVGQIFYENKFSGISPISFDLSSKLSEGIYLITIESETVKINNKLLVK